MAWHHTQSKVHSYAWLGPDVTDEGSCVKVPPDASTYPGPFPESLGTRFDVLDQRRHSLPIGAQHSSTSSSTSIILDPDRGRGRILEPFLEFPDCNFFQIIFQRRLLVHEFASDLSAEAARRPIARHSSLAARSRASPIFLDVVFLSSNSEKDLVHLPPRDLRRRCSPHRRGVRPQRWLPEPLDLERDRGLGQLPDRRPLEPREVGRGRRPDHHPSSISGPRPGPSLSGTPGSADAPETPAGVPTACAEHTSWSRSPSGWPGS